MKILHLLTLLSVGSSLLAKTFSMSLDFPAADPESEAENTILMNEPVTPVVDADDVLMNSPNPRTPMPFERNTTNLFLRTSSSLEKVQVDLLKYETQLNFNTLTHVISILEEIQKNMTELLDFRPTNGVFLEEQSNLLEKELLEVEHQMKYNQALQEHYQEIQESLGEQLRAVNNTLESLLNSQVYIFGHQQRNSSARPKSADEVRPYIQILMFVPWLQENDLSFYHASLYLKDLDIRELRYAGYSTFLKYNPFNKNGLIDTELIGNIYRFPELDSLKESVPPMLGLIFSENKKIIQSARNETSNYKLSISSGEILSVTTISEESNRRWMFYPIEYTEFFHIVDATTNLAIGMSLQNIAYYPHINQMLLLHFDETVKLNRQFCWNILAKVDSEGEDMLSL